MLQLLEFHTDKRPQDLQMPLYAATHILLQHLTLNQKLDTDKGGFDPNKAELGLFQPRIKVIMSNSSFEFIRVSAQCYRRATRMMNIVTKWTNASISWRATKQELRFQIDSFELNH